MRESFRGQVGSLIELMHQIGAGYQASGLGPLWSLILPTVMSAAPDGHRHTRRACPLTRFASRQFFPAQLMPGEFNGRPSTVSRLAQ